VNAVLLAQHHELDIDPALPSMLALLRAEWILKVLGNYLPINTWQCNICQAYNKRAYLMAHIVKRHDADATLLVLATEAKDIECARLNKSVYQYWDHLKSLDRTLVHRVGRRCCLDRDDTSLPRKRQVCQ
jgi:hypothetical protein